MNSKYTGLQVEAVLDQVIGKTVYTAGSGITISDEGVISAEGGSGGGSGGVSKEDFNSATQAIAKSLLELENTEEKLINHVESDYYNKKVADKRFVDNNELNDRIAAYMQTDEYKAIHEPLERATAAAIVKLEERVTSVEENAGGGSSYDDTEIRGLISANTEAIETKAESAHTHTLEDITDYVAPTYKTINGQSILGEGNITIEGGSGGASYDDTELRGLINGKANIEHTHTLSDITDYATTNYTSDYIDSKLRVISAALNYLSDRISALEGRK